MQKRNIKFISEDEEIRSQKSHYTNVSKLGSVASKNVELSLEVEMDDEVRDIIKRPEICPSALLDVTVIKPKGLDKYIKETQILKSEQVRKMIENLKLESNDKKVLLEKIFGQSTDKANCQKPPGKVRDHKAPKSCLSTKNKNTFRSSKVKLEQGDVHCITDETNSAVYSMYSQKIHKDQDRLKNQQQIYTTPKTYENIRSIFACKNQDRHDENEKSDQPCLCQNCAIVGILTDSQKRPFATEPLINPMEEKEAKYKRPSRKKSVSFKHLDELSSAPRSHDQCQAIFKLLSARINELEKRVAMQEEKAVPKDYFKKIISKLVNHLAKLTHYTTEERQSSSYQKPKDSQNYKQYHKTNDKYNRYYVNPILLDNTYKIPAEKELEPRTCSSSEPKGPTDSIWRWGEGFLSSGRDLKNKVVVLLEETLQNLRRTWEKPEQQELYEEDVQSIVEEFSKNLANTIKVNLSRKNERKHCSEAKNTHGSPQIRKNQNSNCSSKEKPSLIPRFMRKKVPTVNVAYVNPQLKKWPEESSVSFKIDSDYESHKANMSEAKKQQYKKEFLEVLKNTKTADKFKLWQSIWNQALENHQNKNDLVTIQIPDPKDLLRQKMIHLEYTIGELERLLTNARERK